MNGKRCSIYNWAYQNREKDEAHLAHFNKILSHRTKEPEKYEMANIPSVWERGLPLRLYVDTPMHLLFLGVAKTVFWYVGLWSSMRGREKAFTELAIRNLRDLDSLKLQWLSFKVDTLNSWGRWVSKKFQSLSRVAL